MQSLPFGKKWKGLESNRCIFRKFGKCHNRKFWFWPAFRSGHLILVHNKKFWHFYCLCSLDPEGCWGKRCLERDWQKHKRRAPGLTHRNTPSQYGELSGKCRTYLYFIKFCETFPSLSNRQSVLTDPENVWTFQRLFFLFLVNLFYRLWCYLAFLSSMI